jgi:gas vesicle protein
MCLTDLRGNMAEENNTSEGSQNEIVNCLAWFFTGAVIGATVAILYAPKSGKQTRQFIAERAQAGKEAVTDTTTDLMESGKEMFERGRKIVDDAAALFDRGRKMVRGEE